MLDDDTWQNEEKCLYSRAGAAALGGDGSPDSLPHDWISDEIPIKRTVGSIERPDRLQSPAIRMANMTGDTEHERYPEIAVDPE